LTTPQLNQDQVVIQSLSEGNLEMLDQLYYKYRPEFLKWARSRFKTTPNDLEDAWQDAVIALYERTKSLRPFVLKCSLRSYLFAIGSKRLLQNHRKLKRFLWKNEIDDTLLHEYEVFTFEWDVPGHANGEALSARINLLSTQCRDLLLSRYYQGKKLTDIQEEFDYPNLNTVSASISRCLKRLKGLFEEIPIL